MKIVDIATSIDMGRLVDVATVGRLYGWTERDGRVFSRYLGFRSVCLHDGQELRSTLAACLGQLVQSSPELVGGVDYLAYSHSLNSTTTVDQSLLRDLAHEHLGCRPEMLSVTQGSCASGILALRLLSALASKSGDCRAVLLSGEKCFHPMVQYVPYNGIYGEATTAVALSSRPEDHGVAIVSVASCIQGGLSSRTVDGHIDVRNRVDREFVPAMVSTVRAALEDAGVTPAEVSAILPYHMSPPTFDRVARALDIPVGSIFRTNLYRLGHCFCGDPFINLRSWLGEREAGASSQLLLTMAAGISGTFSAMVLEADGT